jgi:hypothetical protein
MSDENQAYSQRYICDEWRVTGDEIKFQIQSPKLKVQGLSLVPCTVHLVPIHHHSSRLALAKTQGSQSKKTDVRFQMSDVRRKFHIQDSRFKI